MSITDYITGSTKEERIRQAAGDLFQVREYEGKLWLTFNNCLVCPCDMFKGEPMSTLNDIRDLYVERNK